MSLIAATGILVLSAPIVFFIFGTLSIVVPVCFVIGVLAVTLCFLKLVPPTKELERKRDLIIDAVHNRDRIKSYTAQKAELRDPKGQPVTLSGQELAVWLKHVVPFLIENQVSTKKDRKQPTPRGLSESDREQLEQRRQEILEIEKSVKADQAKIARDKSELEKRIHDLEEAEETIIVRLNGIEQAEAEIEQLRIAVSERADQSADDYDKQLVAKQAEELEKKEAELSQLRQRLATDKEYLKTQKAEMKVLEDAVHQQGGSDSAPLTIEQREAALIERQKKLEREAAELEARASYLTDSENTLIEKLDALTEREAIIEQNEVRSGIRKD